MPVRIGDDGIPTVTVEYGDDVVFIIDSSHEQVELDRADAADAIEGAVKAEDWFDDVHGSAAYKRHLTYYYAEQIRAEL